MTSPLADKNMVPAGSGRGGPQLVREREYTCPMHPEIRQKGPGTCPKCGMALEPVAASEPAAKTEYTCPMHPQIVRSEPGYCPICGMALEPQTVTTEPEENAELAYMSRRFWAGVALTIPLLVVAMGEYVPGFVLTITAAASKYTATAPPLSRKEAGNIPGASVPITL
jgi:hypothetical protein